jgi:hypothetical protein
VHNISHHFGDVILLNTGAKNADTIKIAKKRAIATTLIGSSITIAITTTIILINVNKISKRVFISV